MVQCTRGKWCTLGQKCQLHIYRDEKVTSSQWQTRKESLRLYWIAQWKLNSVCSSSGKGTFFDRGQENKIKGPFLIKYADAHAVVSKEHLGSTAAEEVSLCYSNGSSWICISYFVGEGLRWVRKGDRVRIWSMLVLPRPPSPAHTLPVPFYPLPAAHHWLTLAARGSQQWQQISSTATVWNGGKLKKDGTVFFFVKGSPVLISTELQIL